MTEIDPQIDAILIRALRLRISIKRVCRRAGVAASTVSRWRSGLFKPHPGTIDRLNAALDEFEKEAA